MGSGNETHSAPPISIAAASAMKVTCKVLSHIKLDQSYSLLSARDVSVVLELFKAMDVRGEMALDGRKKTL